MPSQTAMGEYLEVFHDREQEKLTAHHTAFICRASIRVTCVNTKWYQAPESLRILWICGLGTNPTKLPFTSAFFTTKIVGILRMPKAEASCRSDTMIKPTTALPLVSAATSLRTDAIRLHGPQVSL
jgi:hypothetical protein